MIELRLKDLTENSAKAICSWEYNDEYSIYNYPEWNKIVNETWAITIEEKRKNEFNAIVDDFNNLCGQGLGGAIMEIVNQQCKKKYADKNIILEVRSFNNRAIKSYIKSGFNVVDIYN